MKVEIQSLERYFARMLYFFLGKIAEPKISVVGDTYTIEALMGDTPLGDLALMDMFFDIVDPRIYITVQGHDQEKFKLKIYIPAKAFRKIDPKNLPTDTKTKIIKWKDNEYVIRVHEHNIYTLVVSEPRYIPIADETIEIIYLVYRDTKERIYEAYNLLAGE